MKENISSSFRSPEFKVLLSRYEEMLSSGKKAYFESDELTTLAEYYASTNNAYRAESVIDYGLSLHPDNLDLQVFHIHNLLIWGELDKAESLMQSLPDIHDYEVMLLKAELLLNREKIKEGTDILSSLFENEPKTEVALDIAQVCIDTRLQKEAHEWLQKAYEISPERKDVLEMMASYYFSYHILDKAIAIYEKLLDHDPYCLEFWQNLARCHIRNDNPQKAMEAIDFALTIDDKDLISWELKSFVLFMLNDDDEGFKCLQHIEEEAKDKTYIRSAMLFRYYLMEDYPKVIEYSNKLIDAPDLNQKEKASVYSKRAVAYLMSDEPDKCKKDIETGLYLDDTNGDLYITQGEYLLHTGKYEESEKSFTTALELTFNEKETLDKIAYICFRNKLADKAIRYFEEREEKYPDLSEFSTYFVAYCHFILQHKEETFKYMVRGAYYQLEPTLQNTLDMFPKEKLLEFVSLAKEISEQVHSGKINPKPYLSAFELNNMKEEMQEQE